MRRIGNRDDDGGGQGRFDFADGLEDAIESIANERAVIKGLEVEIAGFAAEGFEEQRIHEFYHRGFALGAEEITVGVFQELLDIIGLLLLEIIGERF